MNAETELLWLGAALLLLLGAVASLCVRCSHPGAKRSEKIYEQRNLQENQQNFAVARTYSLAGQAWPGVPMDTAADMEPARKDKLLQFSPSLEDSASPRYQNFSKGSRHGSDAAYIDPIAMDYCNWGQVPKSQEVHSGGDLGGQRRCPGWCLMKPGQRPLRMFKALGDQGMSVWQERPSAREGGREEGREGGRKSQA
ncbi:linker for activation of T-cells family member 2 isoform X3 [Rhinolophus ferrumequinum]|uniref:linker for activation of T-cells family member 2 isoform X3 n=1 Tax=Rhinolophus ferrumequinum TaxID=59479 RepID=UPI00140F98ED|nr:linker for activation of T-cells family member 2 isoform X3 [Rhinolophus ferrumequinum]